MPIWQQGDVLIESVDESKIPNEGLVPQTKDPGRLILAEGEVTGHAHAILRTGAVELLEPKDPSPNKEVMWLKVSAPSVDVVHEEHGTVTIPRGTYTVRKVQEYDHLKEEARSVAD